ncbi:MAG: hypothetical protein AVDCRST_MAG38-57, partial [uncultured Solirubrobacteraceae bacterium]
CSRASPSATRRRRPRCCAGHAGAGATSGARKSHIPPAGPAQG